MINCLIIEDQLPAQRILTKYIADTTSLQLIGTFTNAIEALESIKSQNVHLIFLDIHLPKLSGIDFLKSLTHPPQVILTTAFSDYALESYDLDVVDYLLKPFSFQRFLKAISKVEKPNNGKIIQAESERSSIEEDIYIKSGYDYIRIALDAIIFIMSDTDYTEVHLKDKKYVSSETLRYWESYLPQAYFMRVHKSYLVNTTKISKVSGNQIYFKNDVVVPIGRAYKNDFTERFIK